MPAFLDVGDGELVVMGPRAVDDEVDQDPVQPRSDRGASTELALPGPRPQGGLLCEVLGQDRVATEVQGKASEPRQFGRERSPEVGVVVGVPGRGNWLGQLRGFRRSVANGQISSIDRR